MRMGVMVGPEGGDAARKLGRMIRDAEWAENAGFDSIWIPQVPSDFDALIAVAAVGAKTSRVEIGTAVVPLHAQHPIALARQVLSAHAVSGGRVVLGIGPSHHWIVQDMLGIPYSKPAAYTCDVLDVLDKALHGPGPVDVENNSFTVHNPLDLEPVAPLPVMLSALGPVMLKIAGERADGTILWMADEKAIGDHIAPRINAAAEAAGRPAPRVVAGIPVCLCAPSEVDKARERANLLLTESEFSPNYQRLLDHGNARDAGDLILAGDEDEILAGFQRYIDAGAQQESTGIR